MSPASRALPSWLPTGTQDLLPRAAPGPTGMAARPRPARGRAAQCSRPERGGVLSFPPTGPVPPDSRPALVRIGRCPPIWRHLQTRRCTWSPPQVMDRDAEQDKPQGRPCWDPAGHKPTRRFYPATTISAQPADQPGIYSPAGAPTQTPTSSLDTRTLWESAGGLAEVNLNDIPCFPHVH